MHPYDKLFPIVYTDVCIRIYEPSDHQKSLIRKFSNCLAQSLDAILDLFFTHVGEIQAEGSRFWFTRIEWLARYKGNIIFNTLVKEVLCINIAWNLNPNKEPTIRISIFHTSWKMLLNLFNH